MDRNAEIVQKNKADWNAYSARYMAYNVKNEDVISGNMPSREEIAELYAKDDSIAFVDSILTGYEKKKALLERFMEKGIPAQTGHKRNIEPER